MGARLGQHFLFDPAILARIADAALLQPTDHVLEIGPGRGTLTGELAKRAARVTAIETDRVLGPALAAATAGSNITVIQGDALKLDWPAADVVAGNIPYQITSPLIERALEPPRPKRIVFLVQREVADRLVASAGQEHYGAMSAGVQLVASTERLFAVKAGSFSPPPKVESTVIRITPREVPLVRSPEEEIRVRALIQTAFQRRRQQIQRTLREGLELDQSRVVAILEQAGIPQTARAEELGPEQFVTLARLARPA